ALSPADLLSLGTGSAEVLAYLWLAIESGVSVMICGGTASGKTTTLNAILQFVPPASKIVSIEDTREIDLPHENWVPLVTRAGVGAAHPQSGKASGEIDLFDLLSTALRQRPQYLVVGEVRGREAYTVFQAMATGRTCLTTFHAESVAAMVHRMEHPPISLPRSLLSALGVVVLERQVEIDGERGRRMASLTEIVGLDPDTEELITNPLFVWESASDSFLFSGQSALYERVARRREPPSLAGVEEEAARRAAWLSILGRRAATGGAERLLRPEEFGAAVGRYYRDPERAVSEFAPLGALPRPPAGRPA
ncbi:MAG: type II/IV secretion system ATPase subunit, partial [Thermoplasmata archaeon]